MKKFINILIGLVMSLSLTSCITTAQAQVDGLYDDIELDVLISYGRPIYNTEGLLMYYIYRDLYYYPYIYNNGYHFRRYSRPLPPDRIGRHRPIPRDFYSHRPKPHHVTPHHNGGFHNRPNINRPPHVNRGNVGGNRPSMPQRSSTRNGHFGGRR